MSNSRFRSSFIAEKNKRFVQCRMNNDTFNLNANTSWATVPITGITDKLDKGFIVAGDGIMALFSDWVEVSGSLYMYSTVARANVEVAIAINGVARPVIGAGGYIRNTSGHNNSSSDVADGFNVANGDIITLVARQEAESGTVTSPVGSSMLKIVSSPSEIERGPSGTYFEGFENENTGYWLNSGGENWTVITGSTQSPNTGTYGAKSGAFYVYSEVSNDAWLETFVLGTTHFNLLRTLNFSYQLEGSDCGTLKVQYRDENGVWYTKWSVSGEQGALYNDIALDFSTMPDADLISSVRFVYSGATGFRGDCCLDDITIVSVD